jgi:DNA polymerase-3 subunit alpha
MTERDLAGFGSLGELIRVNGVGPKTIATIEEFCNSDDPFGIERVANYLNSVREILVPGNDWGMPVPSHTSDEIFDQRKENKDFRVIWVGLVRKKNLQDYVEHERAKTGRDVDEIRRTMRDPDKTKMMSAYCYDEGEEPVNVRFSRWIYPRFATAMEAVRPDRDVIVVTGKVLANWGPMIFPDALSVIDPLEEE